MKENNSNNITRDLMKELGFKHKVFSVGASHWTCLDFYTKDDIELRGTLNPRNYKIQEGVLYYNDFENTITTKHELLSYIESRKQHETS